MSHEQRCEDLAQDMSEMLPQEVAALMEAGQKIMFIYDGFDAFAMMAVADRSLACLNPDALSMSYH